MKLCTALNECSNYLLSTNTLREHGLIVLEDVHASKGLICSQIVLHKDFVLASIRRLRIFDGENCVGVSNVKENSERQPQLDLELDVHRKRIST